LNYKIKGTLQFAAFFVTHHLNIMRSYFLLIFVLSSFFHSYAQQFSRKDSLRGALRNERTCFDVVHYDLSVNFDFKRKYIYGKNQITAVNIHPSTSIQLDLFENMKVISVEDIHHQQLSFKREHQAIFIQLPSGVNVKDTFQLIVKYEGQPIEAKMPPWDGGFVWSKDGQGKDWVSVACEGIGASLWWPNKDHLSDEPESMDIRLGVPTDLMAISNGNLMDERITDSLRIFHWKVSYPINNYNVTFYIGNYINLNDEFIGSEYNYPIDYYVLEENVSKAEQHFEQVKPMLECYEKRLGPYPFPHDGFALVESPYLGMEHQSAIAYGNNFLPGYAGLDYSMLGLKFDYIIVHETGHEYWGNSVSMKDIADMWIHEAFCTYSEVIYVECMYGKETALKYANAWKYRVANDKPVQGFYDVNNEGSSDMYYKGALMLHTLRFLIQDDEVWWSLLRKIQINFKYQTVSGKELIQFVNAKLGKDYTWLFNQYLKSTQVPILKVSFKKKKNKTLIKYRWENSNPDFVLPVSLLVDKKNTITLFPVAKQWKNSLIDFPVSSDFSFDQDYGFFNIKK
jgi:aminopeptidase N